MILFEWDANNLLICALVTIFMQLAFFFVACSCKFDKVTDFAGGSNFVVVAILTFCLAGTYSGRQIMVTVFIIVWGLRISGYLLFRIIRTGTDNRFDDKRENCLKFLGFWIFQMFWVFTVSLSVIFINAPGSAENKILNDKASLMTPQDIVGVILFALGLIIETVADFQKFFFRENPENKGKFCNTGLWSVSRHPNYFGEMIIWWGVFVIGSSVFVTGQWTAVLSPLFTMAILLFLSGLPLLEKSADERHGRKPEYREYRDRTPILIPFFTTVYVKLPYVLKAILCFEWPIYNNLDKLQESEKDKIAEDPAVTEQPNKEYNTFTDQDGTETA